MSFPSKLLEYLFNLEVLSLVTYPVWFNEIILWLKQIHDV